jgi:hypothetical protein
MAVTGPGAGTKVALGDVLLIQLVGFCDSQLSLTGAHYLCTILGAAIPTLGEIATACATAWGANFKALISQDATYRGVGVRRISPTPASAPAYDDTGNGAGTVVGSVTAKQVAGLISKGSVLAGRRYRGRMYTPFVSSTDVLAAGHPAAAFVQGLNDLANLMGPAFTVTIGGAVTTLDMVLWHQPGKTPVPAPTVVATLKGSGAFATQRRRGDFGRKNVTPV